MIITGMILTYCSDLLTRVFRLLLLLQSHTVNYTVKKSVTAATVRKQRIMVQTKEASLEAV